VDQDGSRKVVAATSLLRTLRCSLSQPYGSASAWLMLSKPLGFGSARERAVVVWAFVGASDCSVRNVFSWAARLVVKRHLNRMQLSII
jgi:hypothetical protein